MRTRQTVSHSGHIVFYPYLPPLQGEHSLLVALPTVGNVTISYGTQFDRCGEIAHCTFNLHFPNG